MNIKKNRILSILTFIFSSLFLLLIVFIVINNISVGLFPLIFAFMSFCLTGFLLNISLRSNNQSFLDKLIKREIDKGKSILLSELKKTEEEKEAIVDNGEKLDVEVLAKKLIPGGSSKKIDAFGKKLLHNLSKEFEFLQGILYTLKKGTKQKYNYIAGYALTNENPIQEFNTGDGLTGEAIKSQEIMVIDEIPEEYLNVESGLGKSRPAYLIIIPLIDKKRVIGVLEFGSFKELDQKKFELISQLAPQISAKLNQLI